MATMNDRIADTRQCPYCRQWITIPLHRGRAAFERHISQHRVDRACADLLGNVTDTHQTEAEL